MRLPCLPGLLAVSLLAGCAAPDPLPAPLGPVIPERFQRQPEAQSELRSSVRSSDEWWLAFEDPQLNELVRLALTQHSDLSQAKARIDQARAQTGLASAAQRPAVSFSPQASRTKLSKHVDSGLVFSSSGSASDASTASGITPQSFASRYRLPLDASYEPDLWGRLSERKRAALHEELAAKEDLRAARLALATAVVISYQQWRVHQAQGPLLAALSRLRADQAQSLAYKAQAGMTGQSTVDAARLLASDAALQQVRMQATLALDRNALAVLCGRAPGAMPEWLDAPMMSGARTWSASVPADLPSTVLKRRPDLRRAQAQLDAALARTAAARADFFPSFRLTTSRGLESSTLSQLLDPGSAMWSLAGQFNLPILDGGLRQAQWEASASEVQRAAAAYQGAVIQALREVEDGLITVQSLNEEREAAARAADWAEKSAERAQQRAAAGLDSQINAMESQIQALQRQLTLRDLEGQTIMAHATLIKTLGGTEPVP